MNTRCYLLVIVCQTILRFIKCEHSPIVCLNTGDVQGVTLETPKKDHYYAFKGIPYAEPPLGDLRFEPPQPAKKWQDTLIANKEKAVCFQDPNPTNIKNANISEDCLFLSVYTPNLPEECCNQSLPVMFWIYGGGLVEGHYLSNLYGPEYFMDYGVIIVTFNYRLGVVGFLATGNLLPGNAGLKDQLLALKWVKQNIHKFGGDPDRITIFGESSGGTSIAFHLLNPKSENLFSGAIMQSGTALSTTHLLQQSPFKYAKKVAKYINDNVTDKSEEEIISFLKSVPVNTLWEASKNVSKEVNSGGNDVLKEFLFGPSVESNHPDAIVTGNLYDNLASGQAIRVPLIIGFNSEEAIDLGNNEPVFLSSLQTWEDDPRWLVSEIPRIENDDEKLKIGKKIQNVYCNQTKFSQCIVGGIKFWGDATIVLPVMQHAQLQVKYSNVYLYKFSYKGPLGQSNFTLEGADKVGHFEDVYYLWKNDDINIKNYPTDDYETHTKLLTMWTNFAKTSNPTPTPSQLLNNVIWEKMDAEKQKYLDIGKKLIMKEIPRPSFQRWQEIYGHFGKTPFRK